MVDTNELIAAGEAVVQFNLMISFSIKKIDAAIERAARDNGLVALPLFVQPESSDSGFDEQVKAYSHLVELVKRYIEENAGYAVEQLTYPDKIAFYILWKKGSPQDPNFTEVHRAQSN